MARSPQPGRRRPSARDPFRTERLVGIAAGVLILAFAMALVWRDQPFASPDLARMARILLSLGMAAVGATIPGFLRVDYKLGGAVARATGGFGMFLISFFGSPHVEQLKLTTADLKLDVLKMVEFRAIAAPQDLSALDLAAPTGITVYLSGDNHVDQLGRPAVITASTVDLIDRYGRATPFEWRYFVSHVTGSIGVGGLEQVYLGAQEDAGWIAIAPGASLQKSIMHIAPQPATGVAQPWQGTLDAALTGAIAKVVIHLTMREGGGATTTCQIDADAVRHELEQYIAVKAVLPRYFQAPCKGDAPWTFAT